MTQKAIRRVTEEHIQQLKDGVALSNIFAAKDPDEVETIVNGLSAAQKDILLNELAQSQWVFLKLVKRLLDKEGT